jgi:fatty acid desaturase
MVSLATEIERAPTLREEHPINSVDFQTLVLLLAVSEISIGATVWAGWLWLTVPLALVAAHLMHGLLIGFHEASHGLLRKSRSLNEFDGVLIGIFSFLPFNLYRVVHQRHHMYLATEKDTELWPFVLPRVPRWGRRLSAFLELTVGLFYSPLIFFAFSFSATHRFAARRCGGGSGLSLLFR